MAISRLASYSLPTEDQLPQGKANWPFEPQKAALLIHDMQEYFINFYDDNCPLIKKVVDNIQALQNYCRKRDIPIIYTAQPCPQSKTDRALLNDLWGEGLNNFPGQQAILATLAPEQGDHVLTKWRYSAFHRSPLQHLLSVSGRDQLIICGIYAHIGCMITATDAFMRDIKPFFMGDAVADFSRDEHIMALNYVAGRCGRVLSTHQITGEDA